MNITVQTVLQEILYVLLIALIPVIAKYVTSALESIKRKAAQEIKNEKVEATIFKVLDIVRNAVEATNQTFVAELKANGGLTQEDKEKAYLKTYDTVKTLLTDDVINLIVEEYGDLEVYLDTVIEKVVANKK